MMTTIKDGQDEADDDGDDGRSGGADTADGVNVVYCFNRCFVYLVDKNTGERPGRRGKEEEEEGGREVRGGEGGEGAGKKYQICHNCYFDTFWPFKKKKKNLYIH